MNPGKEMASQAPGSPRRLAAPSSVDNGTKVAGIQHEPAHVAALLQAIANEISLSDQRQGQALADLRTRLDVMTERQVPVDTPIPAQTTPPAKGPAIELPDLRAAAPARPQPTATAAAAGHDTALDQVYAAVARSYSEAAGLRGTRQPAAVPTRGVLAAQVTGEVDDADEFLDMAALADPHRPQIAPGRPIPARSAATQGARADIFQSVAPRPIAGASLTVEKSIGDLARRVAEAEDKIGQALQRPDASRAVSAVNAQIDSLSAELAKLSGEHQKISAEVGKVAADVRSLSDSAGRIGPMGDMMEQLNEAILALRKDLPGFVEAAAERTGALVSANFVKDTANTELADKLVIVQNLLLSQSRDRLASDGRSFGALDSIRELVENLHSRIDALEAAEPEPAVPGHGSVATGSSNTSTTAVAGPQFEEPVIPADEQFAPTPSMSREELIASARRAAIAASQRIEAQKPEPTAAPARSLFDLVPRINAASLLDRRGLRPIVTLAIVGLLAMGLGVAVTKYLRKPVHPVTIEQAALPAMPDDLPDVSPKAKADAHPAGTKDTSKPGAVATAPVQPATASVGKTSTLLPAESNMAPANAAELPQAAPAKPTIVADLGAVAPQIDTLPAAIAPLSVRTSAMGGDPAAAYAIAERYLAGKGVTRDAKQAKIWYEQAAKSGYPLAEFRLGVLYEKGDDGVSADRAQAMSLYRKGADHGNVQAMHNLAVLFAGQAGGATDYASAAKWFEQAAGYGLKDSQYNLAVLYQSGLGVAKDPGIAYKWFAIGAARGDAEAGKQRDELRKALPAATITSIDAQVKAWHPKVQDHNANFTDAQAASANPLLPGVGDVQQMLAKLGYDPGTLDGTMTAQTHEAIRTFQQRSGLTATGEISDDLVGKLKALGG